VPFFASTIETQQRLTSLVGVLHEQMDDLGLDVAIVDGTWHEHRADEVDDVVAAGILGINGPFGDDRLALVDRVLASGESEVVADRFGPVFLACPVRERRRLIAVAIAAYVPHEMMDEEALRAACDRWQMDYAAVAAWMQTRARYCSRHGEVLLKTLEQAVGRDLALQVARDDVNKLSLNLATTYEELSFIYHISGMMKLTERPETFFGHEVCAGLLSVLDTQGSAAVILARPNSDDPQAVHVAGSLQFDEADLAALARKLIEQFGEEPRRVVQNHQVESVGQTVLNNLAAVPMISDGNVIGVVLVFNKVDREFDSSDIKLMRAVADQASVFLANHRLYADLQGLLLGVLDALISSIDAKDPYTCGHSRRVALLSRRLAELHGLAPERVQRVYLAGLLHDIGKIGVPESILRKPGKLSQEEFSAIQEHPGTSAKILSGIRQMEDIVVGLLYHHERMDGKGYPAGLKGEEVPVEARIIGLSDCFDAMTSDRVYRNARSVADTIEEIRRNAGTQFDPVLVDILLEMDLEDLLAELRQEDSHATAGPHVQESVHGH